MMAIAPEYRPGPVAWSGIITGTCLVLFLFQKILWLVVPFVLAMIVYYLLLPVKERLVLAGLGHDAAAAVVSAALAAACAGLAALVLPWLMVQAGNWQASVGRYVDGGLNLLMTTLRQLEGSSAMLAQAHMSEEAAAQIAHATDGMLRRYVPAVAVSVAAWAPSLLLAPFLSFFMLRDGWRFKKFLGRSVPNAYFERSLYLLDQIDCISRRYFIGLLQLTLLDTACLALGLWLLGISGPLLLGLATAVLAWVPYVGSVLGCLLVVLVAATDFPANPGAAYGAIGLFLFVRLLDDFVFMPMTVGKSLRMHPLLTVLMIFIGGAVAGVPGLMLVLPVLGVAMVLGETVGMVATDPRLRARHAHACALRERAASRDLGT